MRSWHTEYRDGEGMVNIQGSDGELHFSGNWTPVDAAQLAHDILEAVEEVRPGLVAEVLEGFDG